MKLDTDECKVMDRGYRFGTKIIYGRQKLGEG